MSKSVEEKVVSMKFKNENFESGVNKTLSSLQKLKEKLKFTGASKGLEEIGQSANKVKFDGMSKGIETVKEKFSALEMAGIAALVNITNKAVDAGLQFAKSFTVQPLIDGFHEYETQMNAVQTILANTSSKGTTLKDVNAALDELNTYADKTIYNFTEMTRNIGTFTAAGVDLEHSTKAIKGIANLAAMSGSSSQQASTAMYQLSQALAAGTVNLQDWNSVVNAGMGGEVFQNALKRTAKMMGKTIDETKTFRESISSKDGTGWLTADVLIETLNEFTGDMTDAELRAKGYTEAQIKDIQEMAKTANEAATKVKTFTQLIDTLKEAIGSGWTKSWQLLIGDFEEAKELFTGISDVLSNMINNFSDARNNMLQGWVDLGGRKELIDGFKNAFDGIFNIIKAIGSGFREIFPATTSKQLYDMTVNFKNLTNNMKLGSDTLNNLKSTFKGIFAVIDIVKQVVLGLVGGFSTLISGSSKLGTSLLKMTGAFGEWLVSLDNALKSSNVINTVIQSIAVNIRNFLSGSGNALEYFIVKFTEVKDAVMQQLDFKPWESFQNVLSNIGSAVEYVSNKISELQQKIYEVLSSFGEKFNGVDISGALKGAFSALETLFVDEGTKVEDSTKKMESSFTTDLNNMIKNIGAASIAAIGFAVSRVFKSISKLIENKGGALSFLEDIKDKLSEGLGGVTDTLDGVRSCLQSYQDRLKADILIKIATAIGILAASIVAVSMIDSGKLASSLGAIGGLFAQLLVASKLYSMIGEFKQSAIKSGIVLESMAIAVLILSNAMKNLSGMDTKQILTSMGAILGLTTMMTAATKILSKDDGQFTKGALNMIAFATAIKILGSACKDLGGLQAEQIVKGLVAIGGIMAELAAFMNLCKPSLGLKTATSILILSVAINNMYNAMKNIGNMDWEVIKKSLLGMGGVLLEIAVFDKLTTNTKNVLKTSVSLAIISVAMNSMYKAMSNIGNLDWEVIKKGLLGMGGALSEIFIFEKFSGSTTNTIKTALSLVVVAVALRQIYKPLSEIGNLDWEVIKKGLLGMGGALLELTLFSKYSSGINGNLKSAISLGITVGALLTLAKAMVQFENISWDAITKSLVGMGGALLAMTVAMNQMPKGSVLKGAAIIELCTALNILTDVFTSMGNMSWDGVAKGLTAIGLSLVTIAVGMKMVPDDSLLTALGLTGVASAILTMSKALTTLDQLSIGGIAKGIVAIAGTLGVLAAGIKLMEGSISGTASLILCATALNLLVPPILQLSTITWEGIIKSLVELAGVLTVFGVAAAVLSPVIPAMWALSGALLAVGAAVIAIGAGIGLATTGILALSESFLNLSNTTTEGQESVSAAMTAMIEGIANAIPSMIEKIGEGIEIILQYLIAAIPRFCEFVITTITQLLETLAANMPQIMDSILSILNSILQSLAEWAPQILQNVANLLLALLNTIASNMPKFVESGVNIIVGFLQGIANSLPKIIDAAFKVVVAFINGLADAISKNSGPIADACLKLVTSIVDAIFKLNNKFLDAGKNAVRGFIKGLGSLGSELIKAGSSLANKALNAAKRALDEHSPSRKFKKVGVFGGQGLVLGLKQMGNDVYNAGYNMGIQALDSVSNAMSTVGDVLNGTDISDGPIITPVVDLTQVEQGATKMSGLLNQNATIGIDSSIDMARKTSNVVNQPKITTENPLDKLKLNKLQNDKPKQPAKIQLVLQNGRAIAEYLIDDIDQLMGTKTMLNARGMK